MSHHAISASPRRFDSPAGFSTPLTEHAIVLPTSVEDRLDWEYSLDSQGRKHVDTTVFDYQGYALQKKPPTFSDKFDLPGLASANELRTYLCQTLLPNQIVDQYGDERDLDEIPLDHLTVLQAKLWTTIPSTQSSTKSTAERPLKAQIIVAGHIGKIVQLLNEKYIFVVSDAGLNGCQYPKDFRTATPHACSPLIVKLEPLIHWGTVTPATASHSILAFRRDGKLMEQQEYIQLVRRQVDTGALAYCFDCLHYLWSKRAEARDTMKEIHHAVKPTRESDGTVHLQKSLRFIGTSDENVSAVKQRAGAAALYTNQAVNQTLNSGFEKAMPQLDGSSSDFEELQFPKVSSNRSINDAILRSSDGDQGSGHSNTPAELVCREDSFTLPLRTTSTSPKSTSGHSDLPASIFSTTSRYQTSAGEEDVQAKDFPSTCKGQRRTTGPEIVNLATPPRIKKRKFGRELNTNSKLPTEEPRRSPRGHKTVSLSMKENSLPLVQPLKSFKAASKVNPMTKETKKRKTTSLMEKLVKQKKPRMGTMNEPTATQPSAQADANYSQTTERKPAVRPPSPIKLILNFAKRPDNTDTPDGVATLTYEDFQNMTPTLTTKICWCNKPAGHSTHKKKDHPHISQCTNLDCRFRWFHYACLDLSDKAKARFGKLLCQICRNEQGFAERDKSNGWNVEKLTNLDIPWTRKSIESEMPGVGGHIPTANPYDLGIEHVPDSTCEAKTEAQAVGPLGMLDRFGYTQSHPYMLEEAYLHSDAYASLRADLREEEADEEWWYETRAVSDEYSHSEEWDEDNHEEL